MSASRFIALAAAAAALAACASTPPPQAGMSMDARTPTELWKATVSSTPEEIRLAVHGQGVSPAQAGALADLADKWRSAGSAEVVVQTPVGGPETALTSRAGENVRATLVRNGVPAEQIRVLGYDAKGDARAPMIVGYLKHEVSVPQCGRSWTNIAHSATNEVQPNFGCAVTANMAAQIANPGDLAAPAPLTAADAQRRSVVLEKYRKGEMTSSVKDEQATGAVSRVVN